MHPKAGNKIPWKCNGGEASCITFIEEQPKLFLSLIQILYTTKSTCSSCVHSMLMNTCIPATKFRWLWNISTWSVDFRCICRLWYGRVEYLATWILMSRALVLTRAVCQLKYQPGCQMGKPMQDNSLCKAVGWIHVLFKRMASSKQENWSSSV